MKKVSFAEFGGPDVLRLIDAEEPHAGPGEIRISVRAAGVNPVDWRIREGQVLGAHPTELPSGVGIDAAGVVDEVGEGVGGVQIGDPVFGEGSSTYAEFAVLAAWARMPEGLTFAEAAGYPSVVETAEVGIQPGRTLLVSGASGGVGSAVLQIARERGIKVVGTAGAANQDYLRGLGALATTYGEGWTERVRALGRVDAALDLAGSGVIRELVELTGDPAKVVTIADLDAPEFGVRFSGVAGSVPDALAEAAALIGRGRLHIPVEKSYARQRQLPRTPTAGRATHGAAASSSSDAGGSHRPGDRAAPPESPDDESARQKTDRPVSVVNRSSAATPATELPRRSSPGLHTHRVHSPGTMAMIPPPTPLLPGSPTR